MNLISKYFLGEKPHLEALLNIAALAERAAGNPTKALPILFNRMHLLGNFKRCTPLQNRQLNLSIRNSEQWVDDFVEELTF